MVHQIGIIIIGTLLLLFVEQKWEIGEKAGKVENVRSVVN